MPVTDEIRPSAHPPENVLLACRIQLPRYVAVEPVRNQRGKGHHHRAGASFAAEADHFGIFGKKSVHRRERLFGIICIGSDFRPGKVAVVAAEFEDHDIALPDGMEKTVEDAAADCYGASEAGVIRCFQALPGTDLLQKSRLKQTVLQGWPVRKDRPFQDGIAESDDFHQWYR